MKCLRQTFFYASTWPYLFTDIWYGYNGILVFVLEFLYIFLQNKKIQFRYNPTNNKSFDSEYCCDDIDDGI